MTYLESVKHYYQSSQWLYALFGYNRQSLGMHFGFSETSQYHHHQAIVNQYRAVIDAADIHTGQSILDAGCGVGGAAIYIAHTTKAHVTGISIVPQQILLAQKYAKRFGMNSLTTFEVQDYCHTSFPDQTFDAIYAIESVCYASPKTEFLNEAYRLLKPKGKLVITDGYAGNKPISPSDIHRINLFKQSFALKEFVSASQMSQALTTTGFINCTAMNKTKAVIPSVKYYDRIGKIASPLAAVFQHLPSSHLQAIKWNSDALTAARYMIDHHLAVYYLHQAEKPQGVNVATSPTWT